jgi:hypothetical protein
VFLPQAPHAVMLAECGLDAAGLVRQVQQALQRRAVGDRLANPAASGGLAGF